MLNNRAFLITLLNCFLLFTSCEDNDEDYYGKIELQTEASYRASYLPEDYNLDEYMAYFEEHGEFPEVSGQPLSYTVKVLVTDKDGRPLSGEKILYSADGGSLSAGSAVSDAQGMASVTWEFDGTWSTWGNFYLTISALEGDGSTHLKDSPIEVEIMIEAPPGV